MASTPLTAQEWQQWFGYVPNSATSTATPTASTGTVSGNVGDFKEFANLQFDQTSRLMALSNQYREKEGATQRQVMDKSAQITEQQRQNDAMRAQSALRNFRKMGF